MKTSVEISLDWKGTSNGEYSGTEQIGQISVIIEQKLTGIHCDLSSCCFCLFLLCIVQHPPLHAYLITMVAYKTSGNAGGGSGLLADTKVHRGQKGTLRTHSFLLENSYQ